MTPNDAADALTFECEMLFESSEKDPALLSAVELKVRQIIAAAERAGLCPRLVIMRLRRQLAALCERLGNTAARTPGRKFKNG